MDIVQSQPYDLLLRGGRVIDPAQGLDGVLDVAVRGGRIAAVGKNLPGAATETVDVRGKLVLPGLIDTHAHVYRYVSGRFGLDADTVGVHSGVTTVVDQGGPSVLTFPGFREYVVKPASTRVLAFIVSRILQAIPVMLVVGFLAAAMIGFDCYSAWQIEKWDRTRTVEQFDQAEHWLQSWTAPVVRVFTLGFVNPRKLVGTEVHQSLVNASGQLNNVLWWSSLPICLRIAAGGSLWLTYVSGPY
jgi:hypothetical protein